MARHCSHCLVKSQGGYSFGLFIYDSYVSFRAVGVMWGIQKLIDELVCLLISSLRVVLTC